MMSEQETEYCGFLCGPETEKQQEIIDNLKELKKVNPEFAEEFKNKLIKMLQDL